MATETEFILAMLKIVTVACGAFVVYLGVGAHRKEPSRSVLALTVGMAMLTVAAVSEGLAFQWLGWSLDHAHVIEAVATIVGFGFLVYSVYTE